jgi:UDP-glucose 4-epimerase
VAVFLDRALRGQPIQIWGDGSVVRDYLYVGDVAEALVKAASFEGEPCIFNIGSGMGLSLNDLVAEIRNLTGRNIEVQYTAGRNVDVPANVLDCSRAREHLGWRARTPFAEGLRRTYEWMRSSE